MQAASNMIKELGRLIGLETLELDDAGQCTLAFDETIVLTFVADVDDGLNVVSYVADLEAEKPDAGKVLLSHNFVPGALGGGRVAVEPESARVVLVNRWDAIRCDFGHFQQQLEAFVNAVESIRGDLDRLPAGAAAAAGGAARREDVPPPGAFI
jgi:hypothetical protein